METVFTIEGADIATFANTLAGIVNFVGNRWRPYQDGVMQLYATFNDEYIPRGPGGEAVLPVRALYQTPGNASSATTDHDYRSDPLQYLITFTVPPAPARLVVTAVCNDPALEYVYDDILIALRKHYPQADIPLKPKGGRPAGPDENNAERDADIYRLYNNGHGLSHAGLVDRFNLSKARIKQILREQRELRDSKTC